MRNAGGRSAASLVVVRAYVRMLAAGSVAAGLEMPSHIPFSYNSKRVKEWNKTLLYITNEWRLAVGRYHGPAVRVRTDGGGRI